MKKFVLFVYIIYVCNVVISMSNPSRFKVVITGSTGVLGNCLVDGCLSKKFQIIAGYRDRQKMDKLMTHTKYSIVPYHIDLRLDEDYSPLIGALSQCYSEHHNTILFNNAGVCIKGSAYEVLRDSLIVNAIAPVTLSESLIENFSNKGDLTIVNISSGDGELSYLNSELQAELNSITTMEDWKYEVNRYTRRESFDASTEYAYGEAPMYSVSKAFLNCASRILNRKSPENCKVLAICPGNFQSNMTSAEDTDDVILPSEAANHVINMALNCSAFDGNSFLRRGIVVPW